MFSVVLLDSQKIQAFMFCWVAFPLWKTDISTARRFGGNNPSQKYYWVKLGSSSPIFQVKIRKTLKPPGPKNLENDSAWCCLFFSPCSLLCSYRNLRLSHGVTNPRNPRKQGVLKTLRNHGGSEIPNPYHPRMVYLPAFVYFLMVKYSKCR